MDSVHATFHSLQNKESVNSGWDRLWWVILKLRMRFSFFFCCPGYEDKRNVLCIQMSSICCVLLVWLKTKKKPLVLCLRKGTLVADFVCQAWRKCRIFHLRLSCKITFNFVMKSNVMKCLALQLYSWCLVLDMKIKVIEPVCPDT